MFTLSLFLWAAQVILAGLFGIAGALKSFRPIETLRPRMGWVDDFGPGFVRFVGLSELAGAFGMILPIVTGILPWLTPLAAIGFAIIQVLAIGVHARRGETAMALPMNLGLLALSLFVAWGWWGLLV